MERARIFVSSDTNGRDLVGETDAGGFYRIDGVPPGTITVRASLGTHPNTRSRSVESQVLTGGIAVADIEFPRADASLEGSIYGANMEPAEVAVSLLVTASGQVERYGISRAPGVYAFTSLPAGAATLEARREGSVLKRIGVELVAGQALVQDIYLDTGYEISCAFSTSGFEFDEIWALVIPGEVPAPAMNQEQLSLLRGSALATAKSLEGENVVLGGLEPGTYTVFSWAQPAGFHFAPRDTWPELIANAPSALAVVTLEAGNEQRTVELALQ